MLFEISETLSSKNWVTHIYAHYILFSTHTQTHAVCQCPWGKEAGWRSRAAFIDKCWHKQKADSLFCQVGNQGEANERWMQNIYSYPGSAPAQKVHWSQPSHKVSFTEPDRHAEHANVHAHTERTHSLSCWCQFTVWLLCFVPCYVVAAQQMYLWVHLHPHISVFFF